MKNALLLLSVCLTSLLSCAGGPNLNLGIIGEEYLVDGSENRMTWEAAAKEQMVCIKADDLNRVMSACMDGIPLPRVNRCVFGIDKDLNEINLACADGYIMPIHHGINWACLTQKERKRAAIYCHERANDPATLGDDV